MNDLPQPIAELVDMLAAMPGAVAVVLGGSQALGSNDAKDEKRLIESAGLADLHSLYTQIPNEPAGLVQWVDLVAGQLGVPRDEMAPWK